MMIPIKQAALVVLASFCAAHQAQALGECRKFGLPSYTADRTVQIDGHAVSSRISSTGLMEREDVTEGGRTEVRVVTPGRIVTYDPVTKTGIAQTLPRAPKTDKANVRVRVEAQPDGSVVTVELRDNAGTWHDIGRTTCRGDGVVLAQQFTSVINGSVVKGQMTQGNIRLEQFDKSLFAVPADVRLKP